MNKKRLVGLIGMLIGNTLVGLSNGVLREIGLGIDPFSTLINGLSIQTHFQFGFVQLIVGIFIFLIQLKFIKNTIGIGTIYNLLFLGYTSDFMVWMLRNTQIQELGILFKILVTLICLVIIGVGIALYFLSNEGVAPYDSFSLGVSTKKNWNFAVVRIATDLFCVVIGASMGSEIGVLTVMSMVLTGPITEFIGKPIVKKTIYRKYISM